MEGYLLALSKDRDAQLWFCVLEHGVLRCFTKPNGVLVQTLELTRHDVCVVVESDAVCPNTFAIHRVAVLFDEARAKLRLQRKQQRVDRFAAPSPERMRQWGRAIHNWKRYAFVEPTGTASATERRRDEAQALISLVTSFDLRLKHATPSPQHQERTRASLVSSEDRSATKSQRLSLPTGVAKPQTSRSLAAWLPTRVPSWRRMWSAPSQA